MKSLLLTIIFSCAIPFVAPSNSQAEDNDAAEKAAYDALYKVAPPDDLQIEDTPCKITATAFFSVYSEHIPEFREAWLNRDYSVDFYKQRQKQFFSAVIVKRIAESMTESLYRNNNNRDCAFTINVAYTNVLGQSASMPIATWQFSVARNKEVNWDKIDPKDFMDIALNYHVTPEADKWMSDEPSITDNTVPPQDNSCDEKFLRANAIFIRASTYCRADYMDSPAGYYALSEFASLRRFAFGS